MLIGKKHIIRYYTIVEVMVAMGIFIVMMTIMMQFFTSAQKVWNASSKRNILYADARVAMNVMTREIQSMVYDNDTGGTYPFWHQWIDITDCVVDYDEGINPSNASYTEQVPDELKQYFIDNNDLSEQENGSNDGNPYLTSLNFISATDLKKDDDSSDICEIRYRFVPVYFTSSTPSSFSDVKGGKLVRSCMEEGLSGTKYDFSAYPYPTANRVNEVVNDTVPEDFPTVITGVYSMRFSCYSWGTGLSPLEPMSTGGKNYKDEDTGSTYSYDLITGTPKPVAIRIDMKLMDPNDLRKLAFYIFVAGDSSSSTSDKKEANEQIKNLKQKLRTFSKVIYLGNE